MTRSRGPRRCPRCGQEYTEPPALSRAGLGDICGPCGTAEALEAWLRYLAEQGRRGEDAPETEEER
jgi:hypothetical protein